MARWLTNTKEKILRIKSTVAVFVFHAVCWNATVWSVKFTGSNINSESRVDMHEPQRCGSRRSSLSEAASARSLQKARADF